MIEWGSEIVESVAFSRTSGRKSGSLDVSQSSPNAGTRHKVRIGKQVEHTVRQIAAHPSYVGSTSVPSRHCLSPASRSTGHRPGFTLIEVIVAMAILLIVIVSVLMLTTVTASSLKDSEMRDMAKNIATYTVEYLRSRNVTTDNNFIGTTDWYSASNTSANFPGLVDLGNSPLEKNSSVVALTINTNPALPSQHYNAAATAFYSSLQGYVSLADDPNPTTADPSSEDGNAKVVSGKYCDKTTGFPYAVRFPLKSPSAIKNFTALSGYSARIYTTNANCVDSSKPEFDPHYIPGKAGTMAYRGFRVLTQIVAREKEDPNNPGYLPALPHVQYYDVRATVFWILGSAEHSYSISTQIATYGGS